MTRPEPRRLQRKWLETDGDSLSWSSDAATHDEVGVVARVEWAMEKSKPHPIGSSSTPA